MSDSSLSLCVRPFSGFSYVDLVEGAHDGRFYALKRILCHDREGRQEAQTEVEMHRLFDHPNILRLTGHAFMERSGKSEAWLLLPYVSVSLSVCILVCVCVSLCMCVCVCVTISVCV